MEKQFQPGQALTWLQQIRGGYGYIYPVNATVIRVTKARVVIQVARKNGELVERTVKPESLRERN